MPNQCAVFPHFRPSPFLLTLAAGLFFGVAATVWGSPPQEALATLVPGQPLVRPLSGGETHVLQVSLSAGQYLCLAVEQRGVDIELRLADPQQQPLLETDALNITQGPEVAAIIAAQAGLHRIEIVSLSKSDPAGMYEVQILALRPATEADHRWLVAQQLYAEGRRLSGGATAVVQEQAAQKFAEALRIWRVLDDRLMVVHTLHYLAEVYRDLGQSQHALVYSGYALEILRSLQQPREEAQAIFSLALILNDLGELPKAREYYEQSLTQWRSFQDTYGEARTLINLGLVNSQLGETQVALGNFDHALAVWRKLGNRLQEAGTLARIGTTYNRLGEWEKSLTYATQAQALYRALENKRGEATILNNIGAVYERLGETQKALNYHSQSLALWRILGNRREEAETLSNIGLAEAQQKHPPQAMAAYQLSLKLFREAGDRRGEAQVLQRLGELQASSNDAPAALEFYQQALPLLRTAGDSYREAIVLLSIAELHLTQNNPAQAKEILTPALTTLQAIGNRANEAQARYGLARAERDAGNLSAAQQQIEATLANAEAVRAEVGSQQLRASYFASVHQYHELHLDILMRRHQAQPDAGYDARALQASERARARSLLELLTEARANLRAGVDAALLAQADKLIQQLNTKAQQQLQLTAQRATPTQLQTIKQEISALEDEYNQVEAKIRQSNPHYAALTQPPPLSLPEIQQQLDADSLLLEYALGEERSWLWAVTKDSIASFPLPKRAQIEQAALQFRDLLIARSQRPRGELPRQREARLAQADTQLPAAAAALSQMLLSPVAALLAKPDNQRLIIVADGALQYVPFGALPEPVVGGRWSVVGENASDNQLAEAGKNATANRPPTTDHRPPLIVKHELITLPSASTLAVLRMETAHRQPAPKALAVFADPVFTREEALTRNAANKTNSERGKARSIVHEEGKTTQIGLESLAIPRLPFTRQEAEQILAFVPKADSFKATDFAATRAAALHPALSQYRYLHFATHGLMDSERPGLSSLVLSLVDETGKPQDGFLRAHEIYNLKLPAELVVLSACQTGLGKEVKGEGLMGLTRGFMYAGAARVVVSLWSVNDKATAELMTVFYRQMLKEHQRPAAALRAAQIEMWRQKQWSAPYYWAAFVLQGEWR